MHNTTHSEQTQSILLSPVWRFSTREIKLILCSQCFPQFTGSINVFRVTWDEITSSGFAAAANHTQWHSKSSASTVMRETLRIHLYRHHSLEQSIEIQSCIDLGPVLRDELLFVYGNRRDGVWSVTALCCSCSGLGASQTVQQHFWTHKWHPMKWSWSEPSMSLICYTWGLPFWFSQYHSCCFGLTITF